MNDFLHRNDRPEASPKSSLKRSGRVRVRDTNSLSLIALAGVLDAAGWECVCARGNDAVWKALDAECFDLLVYDADDDATAAIEVVAAIRQRPSDAALPVVLIAGPQWAGMEQKTESDSAVQCLFKPIDPSALLAVVNQSLWMPHMVASQRRRGDRPNRAGWLTL